MTAHAARAANGAPPPTPALIVEDLAVRFDTDTGGVDVVRNIGFTLHKGETLCLVGESGCGKSMTALSLLRLTPPGSRVSGRIVLDGAELTTLPEEAMRRVRGRQCAMIFQEPMTSLNPVLRLGDQIAEPLIEHYGATRDQARKQALRALREVGMPAAAERLRDYPHQLSGGMRQRAMIA
ncbi:MAG: ATP-binding cassette domain-containing protein, partial [Deltaproteobacteria bacterium]|nr:ATP-binding cassette domain-containing protein [Deltaproteobacteria bacterium]